MKTQRIVLGLALVLGAAAIPTSAVAQESGVVAARRQVTEATNAVNAAKLAMDRARVRIAATFKTQNPEYAKAEADAVKAKADMESAKQAAMTALRGKPEYIAAVNAKAKSQEKMRTLQQGGGSQTDFNTVAEETIKQSAAINSMEKSAVENDQKYNDAMTRLAEANKTIEGFKSQIDEFCAADPEYMQLAAQHLQAQDAVVQAQEAVKQAAVQDREMRAAEAKSRSESRKNKNN